LDFKYPILLRGQQRRKAQARDHGEKVAVVSPQVATPPKKSAAKKHPKINGGNLKS